MSQEHRDGALAVFFSYSHEDEALRDELETHLAALKRQGRVRTWHDRKISAGREWAGQIDDNLHSADIILLLVSPPFIASHYCWDVEMIDALKRHEDGEARVIPIILRHADWLYAPFGKLQALPEDGRPVVSWPNRDEAFLNVVEGIRTAIKEELDRPSTSVTRVEDGDGATSSALNRSLVDLELPTHSGPWTPPPGMPWIQEDEFLELVPELATLADGSFSMVEFHVPEKVDKVRGFWDGHLDALVETGKIIRWSSGDGDGDGDGVIIGLTTTGGELRACKLLDSQVLDGPTVTVRTCTPFRQDPVLGSPHADGDVLYPDLPIRGDYLDLVETPDGVYLLESLMKGEEIAFVDFQPVVRRDNQDRRSIRWTLQLRGRRRPLPVEIPMEHLHRAHWMVWPRFRSGTGGGWGAYYVYENCTDRRLHLDTLWLEVGGNSEVGRVRRRLADADDVAYPVSFDITTGTCGHAGGPPLAFSLRNTERDEEQGLYLVPLKVLPNVSVELALGIDFGNSRSIAAVQVDNDAPRTVELLSELGRSNAGHGLSLHLSEDRLHVRESFRKRGLLAIGCWLPTYTYYKTNGFLPSELLVMERLSDVRADTIKDWIPATTYFIPAMALDRPDFSDHILTDLRSQVSSIQFRDHESQLQEHYLVMFLELVMADVVANHLGRFPEGRVNLTFSYALLSTAHQIESFSATLRRVIQRCSGRLGTSFGLQDGIGLYDESHAACLMTGSLGEVVLVGDLGGRSLDLLITSHGAHGAHLAEVADSVRLGGDLLLRHIARSPLEFLPKDGGWSADDTKTTEMQLQAWVRSEGSSRLFGLDAGGRPEHRKLGLRGFSKVAEAARARVLINRYFRLITEFMARNLVAYLVTHWYPSNDVKSHERLSLSIQLRGNGWRLRYQDETYVHTTEAISDQIRQQAEALWKTIKDNPFPFPENDRHWPSVSRYAVSDPESAVAKRVVGRALPYRVAKGGLYSHILVDLGVQHSDGSCSTVDWYEQVPFQTRGSRCVHIVGISPPLLLSSPRQDDVVVIESLEAGLQGQINSDIIEHDLVAGEPFSVPIAPLVWEAIFKSRSFWPGVEQE